MHAVPRLAALALLPILAQPVLAAHAQQSTVVSDRSVTSALRQQVPAKLTAHTRTLRVFDVGATHSTGDVYQASLRLRAAKKKAGAVVALDQVVGSHVSTSRHVAVIAPKGTWRSVKLSLRTVSSTGRVRVWVQSTGGKKKPVQVRDVKVVRVQKKAPKPITILLPLPIPLPIPLPTPSSSPTPTPTPTPTGNPSATPTATPTPVADAWKPDLVENFDSLSSRWNVKNDTYASNESSYLLARNVTDTNGVLRIQGKPESAGGRSYTSGRVDTNNKYALPNYFRAEVRAKVPMEQGMWAAPLWFRPTGGASGEIDLLESYGTERNNPKVHQTIHTAYGADHKIVTTSTPYSKFTTTSPTQWHTYTIEKTPGHIRMWVDGYLTSDLSAASASWFNQYYESGLHWNLRVCLQIGGTYGLPNSSTNWTGDNTAMQLDYIKTWVPIS